MKERNYSYTTIFFICCSMLMFEVLLTRLCALRLFFHFGFLVVSNCLLGIGASGSIVYVLQERFARKKRYWIWFFTVLYVVYLPVIYYSLLKFPLDHSINFDSLSSIIRFFIFNLLSAVPFFFGGMVIGLLLTFNAEKINKIYGFDLLGAGLGCLLCPLFLWQTGAGGSIIAVFLFALLAMISAAPKQYARKVYILAAAAGIMGLALLPFLDKLFPVPSKNEVFITGKIGIEFQDSIVYSKWSATSRVDLVDLDKKHRFILGLGKHGDKMDKLPEEKWIMQDGSAGTYILNFSQYPEGLHYLKQSLYSTAYQLKEKPRVFIIGVGGGNDVWAAKVNGASYIKGIELNSQILDIHRLKLPHFSKDIIEDPNIHLEFDEGRSALMRDNSSYDVIQMSGIDTWTSLTSGAYILAENYLYTTEAIQLVYKRLKPGGIMAITRFAAAMETLRLFSNIFSGVGELAEPYGNMQHSMVCLGHGVLRTILVKKGPFNTRELAKLEQFSTRWGFPFLYHPGKRLNNVIEAFVRTPQKQSFIDRFPRDISPTTDDRPYFFNFYKWSRLFETSKQLQESASVAQGNPFFVFIQLLFSTVLALAFIVLPVLVFMRKKVNRRYLMRFLIYFSGLGLGFIAIEVTMIQKLVLFLGHPIYSITVTLFSMLIFAGAGSMWSKRLFESPTVKAWMLPGILTILLGLFIQFWPGIVNALIVWPTAARLLTAVIVLAPISLLLGIPFAYGIRLLNKYNPTIIPWAWAVNGSLTVIGSILTVIVSMNLGFNVVLIIAMAIYFIAFTAVRKLAL